jgi:uncharacterized protein (TIGR02444 family)
MRAWDFILALYGRDGVQEACLSLQDDHGQCVPLLLWRAWALAEDRQVNGPVLAAAIETAQAWHGEVLVPVRSVRRRLKSDFPNVDDAARLALRQDIATREMAAERLLVETLETLAGAAPIGPAVPLEALRATAHAWGGGPAPDDLLGQLLAD